MNQKQKGPKNVEGRDVVVRSALEKIVNNKSDEVEDTFCFRLFEDQYFDEGLFIELCDDINMVLDECERPQECCRTVVWIISGIFRSIFSHFDTSDRYKISNFDVEISAKWGGGYLEKLRDLLDKTIVVALTHQ